MSAILEGQTTANAKNGGCGKIGLNYFLKQTDLFMSLFIKFWPIIWKKDLLGIFFFTGISFLSQVSNFTQIDHIRPSVRRQVDENKT